MPSPRTSRSRRPRSIPNGTDSHQPDSFIQVRAHLAVTQVRVPVPTQAKPTFPSVVGSAECDGAISCAAGIMASSLAKPVQGCLYTAEGTSVDHSRSCACCGGIGGRHPHPGDNRLPVGGRWCDPVDPGRHGSCSRRTQALLLNRDLPAGRHETNPRGHVMDSVHKKEGR